MGLGAFCALAVSFSVTTQQMFVCFRSSGAAGGEYSGTGLLKVSGQAQAVRPLSPRRRWRGGERAASISQKPALMRVIREREAAAALLASDRR